MIGKKGKFRMKNPLHIKKKTTQMITYISGVLIFSALILTLSLAINELFLEIKEKYFDSHRTKFIANIIYICVLIFIIIAGIILLRFFNIDLDVTELI